MRIAIIASIDKPTNAESKGGVEVWNTQFVKEEVKRGHTIDLYAIAGSTTPKNCTLIETLPQPLPSYYTDAYFADFPQDLQRRKEQFAATAFTQTLMRVKENEKKYDLIIDSCSYPTVSFNTKFFKKPTLIIGHFPVDFALGYYLKVFGASNHNFFIFPSYYQIKHTEFIPTKQKIMIHHGIDSTQFHFNPTGASHMVWMSRVHQRMNKGAEEAIEAANRVKKPLHLFAYVEKTSEDFYNTRIAPKASKYITLKKTDAKARVDRNDIYGHAKVFLFPLQWEEAFGLVLVEAMACGTPVIAFARGATSEIIIDGETGFLVNPSDTDKRGTFLIKKTGMDGICEAIQRLYALSDTEYENMRKNARKHVERHFTVEKMVDHYERVYRNLLSKHR